MGIQEQYKALPPGVQKCLYDRYLVELRDGFDSLENELTDAFMSDPDISRQFNEYLERQWVEYQCDADDAWNDFLHRALYDDKDC